MTAAALARVAGRLGPVIGAFRSGRFVGQLTCADCGTVDEWTAASMPAPDVVHSKFKQRGWALGKRPVCPSCPTPKKDTPMTEKLTLRPSDNAKVAERLLIRTLEDEAYDDQAKRYKSGWSDKRLSTELGLAEKHVSTVREKLFGPAGEPDEVAELRLAIDAATSDLGKLRSRFDLMCAKNGFKQG